MKVDAVATKGTTPLHFAAEAGHINIVDVLIETETDVNVKDEYKRTSLHYAAKNGHIDTAKVLIEKRASVTEIDKYGRTPLHYAAEMVI